MTESTCIQRVVAISTFVLFAVMGVPVSEVEAHVVGPEAAGASNAHTAGPSRLWHDADSGEAIRGRFLSFRDDVVRIERENGEVISIHLHELAADDQAAAQAEIDRVRALNQNAGGQPAAQASPTTRPGAALAFDAFAPNVRTRWDEHYLYVESNGMPAHPMMVGIRAWQQQVPLPQSYAGENAWRIPLAPVPTDNPVSAKDNLFRGAIALAANGVPIFNPIKNDGRTDTFLAGELDEFGGHSGRADDYHYHIAPLHLQKTLGPQLPIAYALDGYPIYGLLDGITCPIAGDAKLDGFNGHAGPHDAGYHYHASKTYPYINGGMHGEVAVMGGQIDPQPRAKPMRPATSPLRGATIVSFKEESAQSWQIEYTIGTDRYVQSYRIAPDGTAVFETTGPDGRTDTKTFRARREDRPPPGVDAVRGVRKAWFVVHAPELDSNKDGVLSAEEVEAEIDKTFAGYDADQDGKITSQETRRPVRSVLGGFVKEHFQELADGQPASKNDVRRAIIRMFDKQDFDRNGKLQGDELEGRS